MFLRSTRSFSGRLLLLSTFSFLSRLAIADDGSAGCALWVPAGDVNTTTTTCGTFLDQYKLSLDTLMRLNPLVAIFPTNDTDVCYGVFADTLANICVAPAAPLTISQDGKCGPSNNDAVCPGSSFGDCCSVGGWCGNGYSYCGIGNCIGGSCTNGTGWSTDGTCGPDAMQPKCGGQFGICCSSSGHCGNSTDHCAAGKCVAGACEWSAMPTPPAPNTWTFHPIPQSEAPKPPGWTPVPAPAVPTGHP